MKEINDLKYKFQNLKNNVFDKNNIVPYINSNIQNNTLIKDISNYIKTYGFNNNNNYIELKLQISSIDIGKDIPFLCQSNFDNKEYFSCNFERDDVEIIIDNISIVPKYITSEDYYPREVLNTYGKEEAESKVRIMFYRQDDSKNCELSRKIVDYLKPKFRLCWNFEIEGIHTLKVIFR